MEQSYGDKSASELLLDHETKISLSATQVAMQHTAHTIAQILRGETTSERFLNVKAKVVCVEEARLVGSFPDQKMKRTVSLADTTGQIDLVLWRYRAEKINFKEGDVLRLDNMVASKFNG